MVYYRIGYLLKWLTTIGFIRSICTVFPKVTHLVFTDTTSVWDTCELGVGITVGLAGTDWRSYGDATGTCGWRRQRAARGLAAGGEADVINGNVPQETVTHLGFHDDLEVTGVVQGDDYLLPVSPLFTRSKYNTKTIITGCCKTELCLSVWFEHIFIATLSNWDWAEV